MNRAILAVVMFAVSCGPAKSEAPTPKAVQLAGERNDALFGAAQQTGVPAEVLMLAAWRQTRFELVEREEVLAPSEPPEQELLDDDVPLVDDAMLPEEEPVDFADDSAIPEPLVQEEQLGIEPDDGPRFGLYGRSVVEVRLGDDTLATARELADAATRRGVVPGELALEPWSAIITEVLLPEADGTARAQAARELEDAWLDGFDVTTADGERVSMTGAGREVAVVEQALRPGRYPPLTVIPAARSNFGSRGGARIRFIVIHDIEGTQAGAIAVFRNPARKASAHYITRASDGRVVKMVNESAAAWHAGHGWFNRRSIGIEHEGFADRPRGGGFYTDRQYQASANLVCAIAKKYRIPIDRKHIFGHGNVPANLSSTTLCSDSAANASRCGGVSHHHDPGRFWAWASYMTRVRRCIAAAQ